MTMTNTSKRMGPTTLSRTLGLGITALTLGACASHSPPLAESARLACDRIEGGPAAHLTAGHVTAISPVKRTEFRARAIQVQRTVGADFYVRAQPGVTAEYLERSLTCHARGGNPASQHDPLHPKSGHAKVDVRTANSGFTIRAIGSTPEAGSEIWQRATHLARSDSAVAVIETPHGANW